MSVNKSGERFIPRRANNFTRVTSGNTHSPQFEIALSSNSEDMFCPQRDPFVKQSQQAIDVGMLPWFRTRHLGMFGKKLQPFPGRFGRDRAISLREVIIDRQRTLTPRLVFDRCHRFTGGIQQHDRREMRDSWEFL